MSGFFSMPNPPLGLGYLARALQTNGIRARILDLALREVEEGTLVLLIQKTKPLFVGITALTNSYISMKQLSLRIKQACPQVPVVLGGVHVSSLAEESIQECEADVVVIGEGEETVVELARYYSGKTSPLDAIKGIVFRRGNEFFHTETRDLIHDINDLRIAWEQINPLKYPKVPFGTFFKDKNFAPIISSRGCPFHCAYCASCRFWHNTIRYRKPERVVDEIEYLMSKYKIKEVHFWDDNLTLRREHVRGICLEIMRRGLKIWISTPNGIRVDTLDPLTLKIMKAAGFYYLTMSVESATMKILAQNGKKTSLGKITRITKHARELGFMLNALFMIGFPEETIHDIKKTIRLSKSLPLDFRTFFIVKPLPGSLLFERWKVGKDLHNFNWNQIFFFNGNVNVSDLDHSTLEALHRKAYIENILNVMNFLRAIYVRFIKHFKFSQLRWNIQKIVYLILG